jgi:hypothetical protein
MTEAEWHSAPIVELLLHTLDIHRARHGAEPSNSIVLRPPHAAQRCDLGRKHMLLAYGVLRRYWDRLDPAARETLSALEAFEGAPDRPLSPPLGDFSNVMDLLGEYQGAAEGETAMALWLVGGWWPEVRRRWEGQELPASWRPLFEDVFGDAFRPVAFESAWRTDTAGSLARQMYESCEFSLMPILADALQDAGCVDAQLLRHCRGPGPHIRGCWAVDLVLGLV